MGKKAKSSRKGKKAWRVNISTEDIDEFFEKSTKDALSGGSLVAAPRESLYYVDKSRDLSVKRKIEKYREKVIRCDSVLHRNVFVQPVPSSTQRKSKKTKAIRRSTENAKQHQHNSELDMLDIWEEEGVDDHKASRVHKISTIPAVEVDPPGCSFNPSFESHQDSLACAVAGELQKVYLKELGPGPVPVTVEGEVVDDEDTYFIEADNGSDNDTLDDDLDENRDSIAPNCSSRMKRVTRVERNKRARRKKQLRDEGEAKRANELEKQIDSLPNIMAEIAKEDSEKSMRHLRRAVAKQERLKSGPPRLGKHKFEPAPLQVLLSEEITGSLRKLKGCCTLARDRFKSFQKRGLVVPTAKRARYKK